MATCHQCGQPTSIWQKDIFTGMCPRCRAGVTPVKLGCGTLIIIAIVVAVASQAGNEDLESDLSSLGSVVQELKQAVDSQTNEIQELHSKIDKLTELQQNRAEKADD
jgi:Sec-independent protein translocase protein TatA